VLSFEGRLAVRLGYDEALLARVAEGLARAAMQDMRWSVKERHGLGSVERLHTGVFTVVQRFRSDRGLYVHLHCLVTDGVFDDLGDEVCFLPAATPTPERLVAVLAHVHKALGVAEDDLDMDPALAACVQLGLAGDPGDDRLGDRGRARGQRLDREQPRVADPREARGREQRRDRDLRGPGGLL
jgi:hypothetical protein